MHPARIAELLQPFLTPCHSEPAQSAIEEPAVFSPAQLNHISTYIDILHRWNSRINLTAIRSEEDIVTRHFGESLFAARHLFPKSFASSASSAVKAFALANDQRPKTDDRLSVADLGSGAGFPGIPLKLWAPHIHLTLIESNHKKATFLREIARALILTDIDILTARAETLTRKFDLVTLRAVERFETILPVAASLLGLNARLALLIGSAQQAQAEATLPSLTWSPAVPIPLSKSRVLLTGTSLQVAP